MAIFNLFGQKSKLGIDLGTSAIKVVELDKSGGRFVLKNYGLFELKNMNAPQILTQTESGQSILKLPDEEIIWGIKELIKKGNIKSIDTIASIPSFSTFTTIIEMPYLSENDLAKALPFEAKKYIPIPLNEVVLDWSIIDIASTPTVQNNKQKPTTVQVFIAAVPRDETEKYKKIMKGAGLNLKALELENTALIRALLGNDLSTTAIVNIGGRSTSIVIVDKGYEQVGHNYEVGGVEITKSISRSLNVSLEKAEELKRKIGMKTTDENIINEATSSLVDMMAFETRKTISNYESSKNQKVARVLLIGGMTNMPNFFNYFKQKLNMEVYAANAFARILYPQ